MEQFIYIVAGGAAALTVTFMVILLRERYLFWASRQVIRDVSRMYMAMMRVVNNTAADRFLIIALHNGGKVLKADKPKKITIVEEFHSPNLPSIKQDYTNYEVGPQYILMINTLLETKVVSGKTEDMEYGFLRSAYEKDGVKAHFLFYINFRGGTHYFGSVSTATASDLSTPQQYQEIMIAVSKIREIMNGRKMF